MDASLTISTPAYARPSSARACTRRWPRSCSRPAAVRAQATGLSTVALVGGVFQNRVLVDLCESGLEAAGFEVLAAGLVPCNDGGIALGQAAVGGYTVLERRGELTSRPSYRTDHVPRTSHAYRLH